MSPDDPEGLKEDENRGTGSMKAIVEINAAQKVHEDGEVDGQEEEELSL